MENPWNERYSKPEYIYGKLPNQFYSKCLSSLHPGKILFLGEGEGRNSVFAAKAGWIVDAYDYSSAAAEKALKLASEENVSINYNVQDLSDFSPEENTYEAVVLIFLHLPEPLRQKIHSLAINVLKPGGVVILEAFDKEQINYTSGGPKSIELLYSLEEIFSDFQDMDLIMFEKVTSELNEGTKHLGAARTIRFFGKKPNK